MQKERPRLSVKLEDTICDFRIYAWELSVRIIIELFLWSMKTICGFESGFPASDSKTTSDKEDAKEMSAKRRANHSH